MSFPAAQQLRSELVRAGNNHHATTTERPATGASRRWTARLSPAVIAIACASVGGVAVAANAIWHPLVGNEDRGHPSTSSGTATAQQHKLLGVLRRAQTQADRGAQSRYALRLLDPTLSGVRPSDVRLLGSSAAGPGFVLFSAARQTPPMPDTPPLIPGAHSYVPPAAKRDVLCLFSRDTDGGGLGCYTTEALLKGYAISGLGNTYYGLVPDGVARVAITDARGESHSAGVSDNFFVMKIHQPVSLSATSWFAADGRRVGPARP